MKEQQSQKQLGKFALRILMLLGVNVASAQSGYAQSGYIIIA
jgi:hypothetical protein